MRTDTMKALFYFVLLVVVVDGSGKKGVVHWADSYMCDDFTVLNNMSWWYDFRMGLDYFHENKICVSTIDNYKHNYVPMVWGYWSDTEIRIDDTAEFILAFNEPNHQNQSNMSPEKAAAAWVEMEKNSKGKPLVSPSAAVCGSDCTSTEIDWFDKFFELCKDCRVDYLATHTYWCDAYYTMAYLEDLYHRYGRKIWLTEFACAWSTIEMEQLDFMSKMLPRLEAADFIYKYAWYQARQTVSGFVTTAASLLEKDGSKLTELGRFYNSYPGDTITTKEPTVITNPTTHSIVTTTTTTPKIVTTTTNTNNNCQSFSFSSEETLLILESFKSNPTELSKMLTYVRRQSARLPEDIKALYETSSETDLTDRIERAFTEIMCCDVTTIQNGAIRDLVLRIQTMPEKKSKKSGLLYVPKC